MFRPLVIGAPKLSSAEYRSWITSPSAVITVSAGLRVSVFRARTYSQAVSATPPAVAMIRVESPAKAVA